MLQTDRDIEQVREVLKEHGYEMIEEIGVGSYGNVFTVRCLRYEGVTFVAKVMRLSDSDVEKDANLNVFNREMSILTSLGHPNIINLFDAFYARHDFILILEYCEYGTIVKYLNDHSVNQGGLANLFKQILSALDCCHAHGIAHRDLKPANILIDKYRRPKLVDFGLSCFVKNEMESAKVIGSLSYLPPEIVNFSSSVDLFKADVWSLGICFYAIATGRTPWPHVYRVQDLRPLLESGITHFPKEVSPALKNLIQRMCNPNPALRASTGQLLTDSFFDIENRMMIDVRSHSSGLFHAVRSHSTVKTGSGGCSMIHGPSSLMRGPGNMQLMVQHKRSGLSAQRLPMRASKSEAQLIQPDKILKESPSCC
jgi:serine/threonine protein kinase